MSERAAAGDQRRAAKRAKLATWADANAGQLQESKASGSKRFAVNFGCPEYARRLTGLRRYALADSSAIARRIALITSARGSLGRTGNASLW